jgi:hypothetical protein
MASAAKLAPAAPLPVLVHRPPAARLQRLAAAMVRTDTPAGRTLLFLTSALLGAALMLGAWQGYRYERLLHAVGALEQEQRHWHERNKQAMDAMVTLGSPRRIDAAARKLGLQRIDIGHRLMVQLAVPEPPARGEAGR